VVVRANAIAPRTATTFFDTFILSPFICGKYPGTL